MDSAPITSSKSSNPFNSHEVTIRSPAYSYACLQLVTSTPSTDQDIDFDTVTARSYINSAMTQFLGIHGSSISVDVLKVEGGEVWIRVMREDLSVVVAAIGGWTGGKEGSVAFRVGEFGNWLGVVRGKRDGEELWK